MKTNAGIHTLTALLLLAFSGLGAAAAADKPGAQVPRQQADQQKQVEQARIADEIRKAEESRKRAETDKLAQESEEDRKQAALIQARERKKREEIRLRAEAERRCTIRPVMSDAEIAKCR